MGSGGSKKKEVSNKDGDGNKSVKKKNVRRKSKVGKTSNEQSPARQPPKGLRKHHSFERRRSNDTTKQIVVLEAENLALDGDWEIEKGVDDEIKPTDVAYPVPHPGKPITDTAAFSLVDFQVMSNNMAEPMLASGTFEEVAAHLTRDYTAELCKVRALATWMSCQKVRTRQYGNEAKPGTVLGYMKQMQELRGTFAGLLAHLCRAIEIPCVIIKGIYKSHRHHVGEDDVMDSKCTWNAVYADGSWQLVHPYLMCTPLATQTSKDNWTLIESSVDAPDQKPGSVLNTFFFAPKPSDFIYFCMPHESISYWQLMETKTRYTKFLKTPFLRPAFFSSKMQLKSEHKSVLLSEAGRCYIKIQCQEDNVNDVLIMYELFTMESDFERNEDWGDLVLCGRNEDTWNIQIKFPVSGTFKLALFARLDDWFFWIGDFKIVCDTPVQDYVPMPTVPREIGFGPSGTSEEEGLLSPSHEGGIVFFKPKEEHVIKFLFNKKIILSHEIEQSGKESEDLQQYCKMATRKSEIDFVVKLPSSGEYALRIYKVDEQGERHNVCNYLFADSDESRNREETGTADAHTTHAAPVAEFLIKVAHLFTKPLADEEPWDRAQLPIVNVFSRYARKNVFQRKARVKLRQTTAAHDIEAIEGALHKFERVKLPHDDDYLRGMRRLNYLKLKKGLRDGRMRRHEGTLFKAVDEAENSRFQAALEPNIDKAKDILESLQSLDIHCHPVLDMDQKTISEIANFSNPPGDVRNTMIATYLLLGEERTFLQKWGNIQALLRRQGKESIKQRVNRFSDGPMPNRATIQQVQQLHDSVPKSYIVSASLSAAAFYDWVSGVLSHLNNSSHNAKEPDDSLEADDTFDELYNLKEDADDENISLDEGFLDSQDADTSTRNNTDLP